MRGRKPKPTELHKIANTLNATRHKARASEPVAIGTLEGDPPPGLTPAQVERWNYALQHAPAALLRRIDRGVLMAWVLTEDMLVRASAALEESERSAHEPLLIRGRRGIAVNPYVMIIERCSRTLAKLASELGFSPASRPRITGGTVIPDAPAVPVSRFAEIRRENERRRQDQARPVTH